MKTIDPNNSLGYKTAHTGAVFHQQIDAGYLRIEGPDRFDFLQRQTTNDINLLNAERSVLTVLINHAARILDVLHLILDKDGIGAITLPGYASKTAQFLQSRIFFNDDVSVVDASPEFNQIDLDGQEAKTTLIHLGIDPPRDLHIVVSGTITNVPVIVIGTNGLVGSGYRLLFPDGTRETIQNALLDSGAAPLTPESYQVLRVEAGLPAAGKELTVEYTPLEAGFGAAISENKGCYTGQEVIARQISYDKVTKHLVGLSLETPAEAGERVWADGKPTGFITSSTLSPTYGPIALSYLKRPYNLPRSIVWVSQTKENKGIRAVVTPLPFFDRQYDGED